MNYIGFTSTYAGIQVSHGVTYHGLAINCSVDLSWFSHITPCGVEGKAVTSLTDLTGTPLTTATLQPLLAQQLASTLALQLQTGSYSDSYRTEHCAEMIV